MIKAYIVDDKYSKRALNDSLNGINYVTETEFKPESDILIIDPGYATKYRDANKDSEHKIYQNVSEIRSDLKRDLLVDKIKTIVDKAKHIVVFTSKTKDEIENFYGLKTTNYISKDDPNGLKKINDYINHIR
jgi:hypothetical protein